MADKELELPLLDDHVYHRIQESRGRWKAFTRRLCARSILRKFAIWTLSLVAICGLVTTLSTSYTVRYHVGRSFRHLYNDPTNGRIYSPLNHIIDHTKTVVFQRGFQYDLSPYQGPPTEERDQAWEDLYNWGLMKIPRSSAAKLQNKTVPIPGDESNYVITIEVFHQLHCLNLIRKNFWAWETGNPPVHETKFDHTWHLKHIDHCIDSIRQSLMCSADVSPLTWMWSPSQGQAAPMLETVHTCRDFDAIWKWGREHILEEGFDGGIKAVDPEADFEPAITE